jgi:lysophospholipase L1-like esterase
MNTNPDAITILCYGDSNTYGQRSDMRGRWPADVRWTGQLQDLLGPEYAVIEAGLSSRTTDLDYDQKPGRNGRTYLVPCLQSHNPLDVVVIMLGTNDLKTVFNRSALDVAQALAGLVDDVRSFGSNASGIDPVVVLVSPIHIDTHAAHFQELYAARYDADAAAKSQELAPRIRHMAESKGCLFVDAAAVAVPGEDGLHIDRATQAALAETLAGVLRTATKQVVPDAQ